MHAEATVHGRGNNLTVSHGDDSSLFVTFYYNKIHERDYLRMRFPGDTKTELDRPVNDLDKRRFAQQWDLYQRQLSQYGSATLLKDAGFLTDGEITELAKFQIETAKQLASLTDAFLSSIGPGAREMQRKAVRFLAAEETNAKEQALQAENTALNNRLLEMEAQIKALMDQKAPAKRGRKPKVSTDDASADHSESL